MRLASLAPHINDVLDLILVVVATAACTAALVRTVAVATRGRAASCTAANVARSSNLPFTRAPASLFVAPLAATGRVMRARPEEAM